MLVWTFVFGARLPTTVLNWTTDMATCKVSAKVYVGGELKDSREWTDVDIMKVAHTRGWCTRQFNMHWDWRKRDVPIRVEWECRYDDGNHRFHGVLSGVNNLRHKRGIFEY
jgi:hypothetical protein